MATTCGWCGIWLGPLTRDLSYRVRFPMRGEFTLPSTTWQSQAPFGVRRSGTTAANRALAISAVPRIRGITRLNEVRAITKLNRYRDDLAETGISDSEFRQLRPYSPGDPIKLINWKASARGSRGDNLPLVNELEPEGRKAVWIFLDTAWYMDVGTPMANPMENTIEAAGSLAQFYLSRGSTIGAYAYNSYARGGELLSPDSGQKQFRRLTKMLTGLKSGPPGTICSRLSSGARGSCCACNRRYSSLHGWTSTTNDPEKEVNPWNDLPQR